jgi:hypothetical protein
VGNKFGFLHLMSLNLPILFKQKLTIKEKNIVYVNAFMWVVKTNTLIFCLNVDNYNFRESKFDGNQIKITKVVLNLLDSIRQFIFTNEIILLRHREYITLD